MRELINIRTTCDEYHKLADGFNQTLPNMKRSVSLDFNKSISSTSIREKETPIHECLISRIPYQIQAILSSSPEDFDQLGDVEMLLHQYSKGRPLFSSVFLYGLRWTGELTTSLQMFEKDPTPGQPVEKTDKIMSMFFGPPKTKEEEEGLKPNLIYNEYPNLNIKLSGFAAE
ncbi:hypothetical protein AJ80_02028 [Polytolypa hystricis UAMH7299]|uniref:Uncharacterized protein n=1 Tax=Polytolypa hystricis (strain UAMH7299) TaxID=1447883 RepID=A0A2B7YQL3_POLH7|nr:hypothetical protein AJ80_02028 [Polytolypa hystricis UAMH7299]